MPDQVYKVVEIARLSETSVDDAISTAVRRASEALRNLQWFKVLQMRGHIEGGEVGRYQVALKVRFTLDGSEPLSI